MHMARMAEKQKRIKNLREFLSEEVTIDPSLRRQLEELLSKFQKFLSTVWSAQAVSAEQESELANYERQLEMLSEEIRMVVTPRVSRSH